MERTKEVVGDKHGFHKSQEQELLHIEATRRMAGDATADAITSQSEVIQANPVPITDGTLNWSGGDHTVTSSPYGEIPFMGSLQQVAGVGSAERESTSAPSRAGLTSPPRAIESNSGKALNGRDIFGER